MAYKKDGGGKGAAPDSGTGRGSGYRTVDYQESVQGGPKDASPAGSGDSKSEGPNPGR